MLKSPFFYICWVIHEKTLFFSTKTSYKCRIRDIMVISCILDFFEFFYFLYVFKPHLFLALWTITQWGSTVFGNISDWGTSFWLNDLHNQFVQCFVMRSIFFYCWIFFLYFDLQENFFLPSGLHLQRISTI